MELGFAGRFGAALPRISDGSMLFLQTLVSKMEAPEHGGGREGILLSGSPLFNGSVGSGESEIRRWLLEQDFVEAIFSLPNDMFFNTGKRSQNCRDALGGRGMRFIFSVLYSHYKKPTIPEWLIICANNRD